VLGYAKYNNNYLLEAFESEVNQAVRESGLSKADAEDIMNNYKNVMKRYTYLDI
jgi:arginine decarboxylase-like protein